MKVANLIVFDIETGGRVPEDCAITEIALVAIDTVTLEEIDRYEAIIAPYCHKDKTEVTYEKAALDYSGMTMAKIQAGKPAKEVADDLESFFKKHKAKIKFNGLPILAGHNAHAFDIPFLLYFLWLHGKVKLKKSERTDRCFYENKLFASWDLDTLFITRMMWAEDGSIVNHKLGTACEKAGHPLFDAHQAMNDAAGNADLLRFFIRNLRSEGEKSVKTVDTVRKNFKF